MGGAGSWPNLTTPADQLAKSIARLALLERLQGG